VRTALVTGASSGIGAATAAALVGKGYRVLGTSRAPASVGAPVPGVEYLALELTDPASIEGCAAAAGDVDVLVNNAGESQSGPLEDLPLTAVERLFAINVLGPVHLTQLLLPSMRRGGYGRVVMVGSMLASFPLAYRSSYVASKAAIKGFATAARYEMAPYGVWITTVEPGSINTGISTRRTKYIADGSPHTKAFKHMLKVLDGNEREGTDPRRVARTIVEAIESDAPDPLYAVGSNAPAVFALKRVLPASAVEGIVHRSFGISRKRR
jgi:NAD(P)-dependent dehydrogenase (short-subunit alcohol dehydrogenase family)